MLPCLKVSYAHINSQTTTTTTTTTTKNEIKNRDAEIDSEVSGKNGRVRIFA